MKRAIGSFIVLIPMLIGIGAAPAASEELSVRLRLAPDDVRIDRRESGDVVRVDDAAFLALEEEGQPPLPYRIVNVLLPQGQRMSSFRVTAEDDQVLADAVSLAGAPPVATEDGIRGRGETLASVSDGVFPGSRARFLGEGRLHGYAIASFAVYPLRVASGAVLLSSEIALSITTEADEEVPVARRRFREGFRTAAEHQVADLVVNPEEAGRYQFAETAVPRGTRGFSPSLYPSLEGSAVDYVIVTNDSLAATFQLLADFKTEKGVPTVVRTTEWILANYRNGSDPQETIRNFVKDAYEKWGITYLLLGGDTDQVPARLAWSGFYDGGRYLGVDMYYGCLDGDWNANHNSRFGEGGFVDNPDLYAEVYVGRMPAVDNASAAVLIDKVMRYEAPADPSYLNRILLLAEVLFPKDWQPPQAITLNGGDLSEVIRLASFTDPGLDIARLYETESLYPGSIALTRQAAIDSINSGFNFVNHIGHGFRFNMSVANGSIQNADADAFTNGDRLSNFYLLNCTALAYTYFCLAEHLLHNPNGGAVTAIGANESAFPNASSHYMNQYYNLIFNQGEVHVGEVFARSRLPRTPLAVLGDNVDLWTHYIYTCLADPEMPLFSNSVDTLQVTHTGGVGLGTTAILVTVNAGGGAVDSATVCLSKDDDDYQVGTTDGAGQVTLDFRAESAGVIKVVVTGRNHSRNESSITVSAGAGAYVALAGHTVVDAGGGTVGNGDGTIDAGETVDLALSAKNTGALASGNVELVLRTNDAGVTIVDSTASVGVVAASSTVAAGDSVRVSFDATLSDEAVVTFAVVVKENGVETWYDELKKVVHAPRLDRVTLRVDDTASGNGNGVVDANEEFRLYYGLKNFGTGAMPAATATIADVDGGFVFTDSTDTYAALASVTESENVAGFLLKEPATAMAHRIALEVTDLYGRAYRDTFELRAPSPPTTLLIDPGLGPDRLQVSWNASPSADVTHYVVYRSSLQGGPYMRATVDPVLHSVFVDVGLASSTKYYYVVSAVDSSGNQSVVSAEKSGSTNPAQMPGWPIGMASETVSSPVLGDIDGDGDMEIVVGDDLVYAWHHDGAELVNGDGDAQSWGVISPLGDAFVSHIALARIDNQPGQDIVAASRVSKEVYVFDYTGAVVAGWPQPVEHTIRAGVAVGDLDGDNLLEIVACDEFGVLYAWRADGSEFIDGDANPLTPGVFKRLPGCSFQYSTAAVVDIDSDNMDEIIIGTEGDSLYVFNGDGSLAPGWPVGINSDVSGSVAVGDIDNNGDFEIVANTRAGTMYAFHHDGTIMWVRFAAYNLFFGPSPALGDVTGDGNLEAFIPNVNGKLYGITKTGADLPGWPVVYSVITYTESSPIVVDMDGDGNLDVVLGDESGVINGWDVSGALLDGFPLGLGDAVRATCAAADLDGDGDTDLVAAGWDKNVYVWDFAGAWDENAMSWRSFHANAHNSGYAGSDIPTAILNVSFNYSPVRSGGVDLAWSVPAQAGYLFDIERAPVSGSDAGAFARIASNVSVDADGSLRFVDRGARAGERYVYRIESTADATVTFTTNAVYVPVDRAELAQNYPNPFNPETTIEYLVPDGAARPVSLVIFDVTGARVRTLVDGATPGGRHQAKWDGRNDRGMAVSSGLYFYRLVQPGYTATRKMLLVK